MAELVSVVLPELAPLLSGATDDATAGEADATPSEYRPDQLALALLVYKALSRVEEEAEEAGEGADAVMAMFPRFVQPSANGKGCPLLRPKQIESLTEPLKLATATFPRLHLAWRLVLDEILPEVEVEVEGEKEGGAGGEKDEEEGEEGLASLTKLWGACVDGPLVNGSHQMKGVALVLLAEIAPRLSPTNAARFLSPSMVRLVMNSTKKADNYLHDAAKVGGGVPNPRRGRSEA